MVGGGGGTCGGACGGGVRGALDVPHCLGAGGFLWLISRSPVSHPLGGQCSVGNLNVPSPREIRARSRSLSQPKWRQWRHKMSHIR